MYKKASRLKLRFLTEFGEVTVDQLWDLKLNQLKKVVVAANKTLKALNKEDDELDFLEDDVVNKNPDLEIAKLKFDILKDVYVTRVEEKRLGSENAKIDKKIERYNEILAEKQEEKLKNMSEEEILKLIDEERAKKK